MPSKKPKNKRYLLGDSNTELKRLQQQSKLWDPITHRLFDRIRIKKGWKVLEIGPGLGSIHLNLRKRVAGPVDAVDQSPVFLKHIAKITKKDGFGAGTLWNCTLSEADLPKEKYDLIFCRWVFLFLSEPEKYLKQLKRALKAGGIIAIQDYHRETFSMIPEPPEWENFKKADVLFFSKQNGNVSIAGELPQLYEKLGLEILDLHPTTFIARPGSDPWQWMTNYFLGIMDRYGKFKPFTKTQARSLANHWRKMEDNPASFLISPTVVDMVARKPSI